MTIEQLKGRLAAAEMREKKLVSETMNSSTSLDESMQQLRQELLAESERHEKATFEVKRQLHSETRRANEADALRRLADERAMQSELALKKATADGRAEITKSNSTLVDIRNELDLVKAEKHELELEVARRRNEAEQLRTVKSDAIAQSQTMYAQLREAQNSAEHQKRLAQQTMLEMATADKKRFDEALELADARSRAHHDGELQRVALQSSEANKRQQDALALLAKKEAELADERTHRLGAEEKSRVLQGTFEDLRETIRLLSRENELKATQVATGAATSAGVGAASSRDSGRRPSGPPGPAAARAAAGPPGPAAARAAAAATPRDDNAQPPAPLEAAPGTPPVPRGTQLQRQSASSTPRSTAAAPPAADAAPAAAVPPIFHPAAAPSPPPAPAPPKAPDTLKTISERLNLPLEALLAANPAIESATTPLARGTRIVLPKAAAPAATKGTSTEDSFAGATESTPAMASATLLQLSQQLRVDEGELLRLNPSVPSAMFTLPPGMRVNVALSELHTSSTLRDLASLANALQLAPDELARANPRLSSNTLLAPRTTVTVLRSGLSRSLTLGDLARRLGLSRASLLEANPSIDSADRRLVPGHTVFVPPRAASGPDWTVADIAQRCSVHVRELLHQNAGVLPPSCNSATDLFPPHVAFRFVPRAHRTTACPESLVVIGRALSLPAEALLRANSAVNSGVALLRPGQRVFVPSMPRPVNLTVAQVAVAIGLSPSELMEDNARNLASVTEIIGHKEFAVVVRGPDEMNWGDFELHFVSDADERVTPAATAVQDDKGSMFGRLRDAMDYGPRDDSVNEPAGGHRRPSDAYWAMPAAAGGDGRSDTPKRRSSQQADDAHTPGTIVDPITGLPQRGPSTWEMGWVSRLPVKEQKLEDRARTAAEIEEEERLSVVEAAAAVSAGRRRRDWKGCRRSRTTRAAARQRPGRRRARQACRVA